MYNRKINFSLFSDKLSLNEDELSYLEDETYLGNNTEGVDLLCHYKKLMSKKIFLISTKLF